MHESHEFKLGDKVAVDCGHARGLDWTGTIVLHEHELHVKYDHDGDLVPVRKIEAELELING